MDLSTDSNVGSDRELALVFEGGGAKGVAYIGALRAIEQRRLRIGATAGASAGAITATLVAAGFSAGRLESELREGLHQLGTQIPMSESGGLHHRLKRIGSILRLLWRLRKRGAALKTSGLRTWLAGLLHEKVPSSDGNNVTFEELFAATGIELYVVAANVSRCEQLVFNHRTTPKCQVVDAVLASSGIPGALPSSKLVVDEPSRSSPKRLHTIVDGGVWANYPAFVFLDASFRQFYGFGTLNKRVIGLILHETEESILDTAFGRVDVDHQSSRTLYQSAEFLRPGMTKTLPRTEAVLEGERKPLGLSPLSILANLVFYAVFVIGIGVPTLLPWFDNKSWFGNKKLFLSMLAAMFVAFVIKRLAAPMDLERKEGIDDCWPRNRLMRCVREALRYFELCARFLIPYLALLFLLMLIMPSDGVKMSKTIDVTMSNTIFDQLGQIWIGFIMACLVFIGGYILVSLVSSFALLALLKRTLSDWGWGVMRTYGAGPGAPVWCGEARDDWVVRVPIPREVSTFSFGIYDMGILDSRKPGKKLRVLPELLRKAEESVGRQLDKILANSES